MFLGFAVSAGAARHGPAGAAPPPPPPPALAAPVLSGTPAFVVDPITRNATTAYNADIAAQHYWRIYAGAAAPGDADIRAGTGALAAGDFAASAGSVEADWALPADLHEPGATVHVVARVLPDGPWSNILTATGVDVDSRVGAILTETFGAFAVGNDFAQLSAAGWFRTNSSVSAVIEADADGPAGRWLRTSTANTQVHQISRTDISDTLAAVPFSSVEVLLRLRAGGVAGARGGFGWRQGSAAMTGLGIARTSGGTNLTIGQNFDPNNAGAVSLLGGVATGVLVWVRLLYDDGTRLRGKAWTGALADEPASWSAPVTLSSGNWPANLRNMGPITRAGTSEVAYFLGFSVGIDRQAPSFYP